MKTSRRNFIDRRDAGFELGKLLEPYYRDACALVLAVPRGGILVAYDLCQLIHGELSVVVTKKIPHPNDPELAIGAVAEDGSVYLNPSARQFDERDIQTWLGQQQIEIDSRIQRFGGGKPLPEITKRTVIIVDDGIATGATLVPVLELCRNRGAKRIVVAVPVAGKRYVKKIDDLSDEVVIAVQPDDFSYVGQVYEDFHELTDEEVLPLLHH